MDGTRPWTLTIAALLLMVFSFVNLAIPLIRGPEDPSSPTLSSQLLVRSAGRAMGYQPGKLLPTPDPNSQPVAASTGMGFGASSSTSSGPNTFALALLCLAGLLSGLAFFAAVGLLQTRWYGMALALLTAGLLLVISIPQLRDFLSLGLQPQQIPPMVAIDAMTGVLILLLVLLPVSLKAFRHKHVSEPGE